MASYNEITGNCLVTKPATEPYRKGWDGIDWGNKQKPQEVKVEQPVVDSKPDSK